MITTPALLLTLVLASGLSLSDIITLAFFDLVMIITGLVGALVESTYKWGFYTFGCVSLVYIWWVLFAPARQSAGVIGPAYKKTFTISAAFLSFIWLLYPIAWGLADGGNVISPDSEMVFYGILDVIAKPVYTLFHLFMVSKLDLTALQLYSGKFTSTAVIGKGYDVEKTRFHSGPHDNIHGDGVNETGAVGTGVGTTGLTSETIRGETKRGFFGRKGRYDATKPTGPAPGTDHHTVTDTPNPPRISEATAVSQ